LLPVEQSRTRWDLIADGSVRLPANETLGLVVEETATPEESISFTWTVPPEYCNTAGNLQGGVLAAFADALLGAATAAHLPQDHYPSPR
jgi:acyl-coenzyme A thioesterase PaaI-like protein